MTPDAAVSLSSLPGIALTGKPHLFQGYVYGFHQPTLRYQVHGESVKLPGLSDIDRMVAADLGIVCKDFPGEADDYPFLRRLQYWPSAILKQANHPVFEPARILEPTAKNPDCRTLIQPCMDHRAALSAVAFVMDLLKTAVQERPAQKPLKELKHSFEQLLKNLSAIGLQGFNQLHFLQAASELGIAWHRLRGPVFRFGLGCKARWLESSYTDATPIIFSSLARDKAGAALLLKSSGLPVPRHFIVKTREEAVLRAEEMGYPVVVKPADLDGGRGVKANLRTAQSVIKAFSEAEKLSKRVLVEKHVPGRDYRIHVVNGEVHGVLERVPGGVTGNGRDSVHLLLEEQNHQRAVAEDDRRYLHQMAFDDEAKEQLADQNLNRDSVPADGQFVRLRGACNVASGGIPIPVPLQQLHPDNLDLVLRAARVMKLDVAGIDLLIPDIARSWFETGASICEVNGQPQMFTTLHKPMLQCMFRGGNGRIPVAIIVEAACVAENISTSIHGECRARGVNAGHFSGREVRIGDRFINKECSGALDAVLMLSVDDSVEALIIHVTDNQVMSKGWPVDFCDVLLVGTRQAESPVKGYSPLEWLSLAEPLSPRCVCIEDSGPEIHSAASAMFGCENVLEVASWAGTEQQAATAKRVVDWLLAGS